MWIQDNFLAMHYGAACADGAVYRQAVLCVCDGIAVCRAATEDFVVFGDVNKSK